MTVCIVVGDAFGGEVIQQMLKRRGMRNVRLFRSSGRSSAQSLARSLLGVKRLPVALVLDAEEANPNKIEEQGRHLATMLGMVAPREEWELLLMVPEMEAVFFQVPGLLESIGLPRPSPVQEERARYMPKQVLTDLLTQVPRRGRHQPLELARRLSRAACDLLWTHDTFSRLASFIARFADAPEAGVSESQ